jgi:hypothetical protein
LIDKGVTVEQGQSDLATYRSRVMVHCYLMYGYPTQTVQETVDSLEMVRLQEYCSLAFGINLPTAHSPVGIHPEKFGVKTEAIGTFANNDIDYIDSTGIDHNKFSFDLRSFIYFMHGICFD